MFDSKMHACLALKLFDSFVCASFEKTSHLTLRVIQKFDCKVWR